MELSGCVEEKETALASLMHCAIFRASRVLVFYSHGGPIRQNATDSCPFTACRQSCGCEQNSRSQWTSSAAPLNGGEWEGAVGPVDGRAISRYPTILSCITQNQFRAFGECRSTFQVTVSTRDGQTSFSRSWLTVYIRWIKHTGDLALVLVTSHVYSIFMSVQYTMNHLQFKAPYLS